jgi:hypothetical protein
VSLIGGLWLHDGAPALATQTTAREAVLDPRRLHRSRPGIRPTVLLAAIGSIAIVLSTACWWVFESASAAAKTEKGP